LNSERARAEYFFNHIKDDVKDYALDFKDRATGFASLVTGGMIGKTQRVKRQKDDFLDEEMNHEDHEDDLGVVDVVVNPMQAQKERRGSRSVSIEMTSLASRDALYTSVHGDDVDIESGQIEGGSLGVEDRVRRFYAKHNPAKLDQVPSILAKYEGREDELMSKLRKQYPVTTAGSQAV